MMVDRFLHDLAFTIYANFLCLLGSLGYMSLIPIIFRILKYTKLAIAASYLNMFPLSAWYSFSFLYV